MTAGSTDDPATGRARRGDRRGAEALRRGRGARKGEVMTQELRETDVELDATVDNESGVAADREVRPAAGQGSGVTADVESGAAADVESGAATVRSGAAEVSSGVADREAGMATAEYAIATLAAVGLAGLMIVILKGDMVKGLLEGIIKTALSVG